MCRARAGRCDACVADDPYSLTRCRRCTDPELVIDGELPGLAKSGMHGSGFREIFGFTSKESEAMAGISGKNLLYIIDEATGVPDKIFEAIEGNMAGGAKIVMFSNPTKSRGYFYDAFHGKSKFWTTRRISSENTPNVLARKKIIPGLATFEYIEEKREEWGEDSALYKIRIKGEHVSEDGASLISPYTILQAEDRWEDDPGVGPLVIGLDPAGDGEGGDETVFAICRGTKILKIIAKRGLSEDAIAANLSGIITEYRDGKEDVTVNLDREGKIGFQLYGTLSNLSRDTGKFKLVGIRASDRAHREPLVYDRLRDELWGNLAKRLKECSIPADTKLQAELACPTWQEQVTGKLKATAKSEMRRLLGRSPDRADAVALALWGPGRQSPTMPSRDATSGSGGAPMDPWAGRDVWG